MGVGSELGEEAGRLDHCDHFLPRIHSSPRKPFGNRGSVRGKWEPKEYGDERAAFWLLILDGGKLTEVTRETHREGTCNTDRNFNILMLK